MKLRDDKGITFFIEISQPLQIKPGYMYGEVLFIVWWLYFAVGFYKVPQHVLHQMWEDWKYPK